ncbi:MAG: penicillin-binding protein 1C [Candidatus Muirbacterium halophilum]|nr:penicillin-binding protein 1C [Candidatus Muirbacterium halophilum]
MFFVLRVHVFPLFNNDYSKLVYSSDNSLMRIYINNDEQYKFPDTGLKIPKKLEKAVLTFEDKRFYTHFGIDPIAVIRALYTDFKALKIISGASTITMQLARISRPKERNFINKIIEMFSAFAIEIKYSKSEILKLYLLNAPYGGNIIGFEAASILYFSKSPEELTWAQAAMLAVLPNSPNLITPIRGREKLLKKRNKLLLKLKQKNIISIDDYNLSIKENLPEVEENLPFIAPHLCDRLVLKTENPIIKTYIDIELQRKLENLCQNYENFTEIYGVKNVSAIIVENSTGKCISYIGSGDYFDLEKNGMVNGVIASRSTGSILKPFLYAKAFEEGLIIPEKKLFDIPIYFGPYSPQNYDNLFRGLVRADEALIKSLNVPAVLLLNQYGIEKFYYFLKDNAYISTLWREADDYGLSLILGGAEGKLSEIISVYTALANDGIYKNILYEQNNIQSNKRIFSTSSSQTIIEILKKVKRPEMEYYIQKIRNNSNIAWKTGTSYGFRDAWACGVTPKYSVGVWVGNFSGEGNNFLTGSKAAAPLMFDVFNILNDNTKFQKNETLYENIVICNYSGKKASEYCDNTSEVSISKDNFNYEICSWHKKVAFDKNTDYEVCSFCWDEKNLIFKNKLIMPDFMANYIKDIYKDNKGHNPNCKAGSHENPTFIYPSNNAKIIVPKGINGNYQKIKIQASYNKKAPLYWFINDKFICETNEFHEISIEPEKGFSIITIVSEKGNKKQIKVYFDK